MPKRNALLICAMLFFRSMFCMLIVCVKRLTRPNELIRLLFTAPLMMKLYEKLFPAIAPSFRDIIKENHWTVLNFQRLSYLESGDFRGYARLPRADLFPCHVCLRHRRDMVSILLWMDLCDWHLGFLYLPFSPPYWPHLLQREVLPRRRLEGRVAQSKSPRSRRKSETPALR